MRRLVLIALLVFAYLGSAANAEAAGCRISCGDQPDVGIGNGSLTAAYVDVNGEIAHASNTAPEMAEKRWRLRTQCEMTDPVVGGCEGGERLCPPVPDRVIGYYIAQSQALVRPDAQPVDGQPPPPGVPVGSPYGQWHTAYSGCVDVTDLNPPPSPDEVFRYFQALPLPELIARQQPPGNGLVGLPVIFYTDSAPAQTFTVDIRGFTVVIQAAATGFTWHTGDGTVIETTAPGKPYPDQTVTHDYRSGTYTAYLTTTWGAQFTVDGGPPQQVPGTTTTDGPATTFTVLQARTVLTNPYD